MMDFKNRCCFCSLNLRLALDVLQIISCNIVHFCMEGSGFYLQENSSNYNMGEFIWYIIVNTMGFVTQVVVLIKVTGCTLSNHFLRLYYIVSFLLLLCIATIVTAISYTGQPDSDCNSTLPDPNKNCNGKMSASKFGFEFAMFMLTALTAFLYLYSFTLTFCTPKPMDKGRTSADVDTRSSNNIKTSLDINDSINSTSTSLTPSENCNTTHANSNGGDNKEISSFTPT